MGEDGLFSRLLGCCCGGPGLGEELYRDWDSHPACQQYTTLRRLGEGGFAEVHLAEDKLTGRTVALKVVFLNKAGLTRDQKKILAGEARLVRMVAHPHIVRCLQVLETRRQQVLVLEYLSGGEMLKQLQRMKRYSEANACQMFKQIVDAVAYLHSLGILHRDIKPENCLLAKPASHYAVKNKPVKVKLIDLGMAGLYRPNRPVQGCMGSPGFIAPEVILGESHTPAMDIYSLGVLLFVMLVGRKPWDAQHSHTLAYAAQTTCEAPGLGDPVFVGLSAPAKQLLLWMLAEEPSRRPTAQQVLGHTWILHGGCCKADGSSSTTATAVAPAAGPQRVYQQVVQQRLQVLARSRDIMGTARGMMLLHGSGSRSQAVMCHRAVKAARLQLQQQAAALQASGQLPALQAAQGAASFTQQPQHNQQQQQQEPTGTAATAAGTAPSAGAAAGPMTQAAQGAAAFGGAMGRSAPLQAALSRCSAPVAAHRGAVSSSTAVASGRAGPRALPRPASAAEISLNAPCDAASGEPAASHRRRSGTVGQLAREDLHRMQGVLFNALQQQQQQHHAQQQQQAGSRPQAGPLPGRSTPGRPGWHRSAVSEGGAALAGADLAGFGRAGASSVSAAGGAAAVGAGGGAGASPSRPITIDMSQLQVDVLERGMSAPNADMLPFSAPGADKDIARPCRLDWAVSVSPGALALLDADDQLCLLQAAGTSVEDDGAALLAGGALSWGRHGAADMVASFKQHYPIKPVVSSIARFGQSLSRSLSRSIRSPRAVSMSGSGRYMDAAAAAIAAETYSGLTSAQPSVSAAAEAAGAHVAAAAATTAAEAAPAAALGQVQFTAAGPTPAPPGAWLQPNITQQQQALHHHSAVTCATAALSSAAGQTVPVLSAKGLAPRCSDEGSVEQSGLLGAHFSLDSTHAHIMWEMSMELPFSPGSSLRCSTSDPGTGRVVDDEDHPQKQQQQQQHQQAQPLELAQEHQHQHRHHHHHHTAPPDHQHQHRLRSVGLAHVPRGAPEQQQDHVPVPADADAVAAEAARSGSSDEPTAAATTAAAPTAANSTTDVRVSSATDMEIARVSASSAASSGSRPSAFATFGGFAAATAALDGANTGSPAQHHSGSAGMLAALQSPSIRAAATAAAARAEEEGTGLPNGLWLQQSQSVTASAAAALLKLLSKDSADVPAAAATGDTHSLSAAGSAALLPAASSRTLSGQLSPARAGSGSVAVAEATSVGQGQGTAVGLTGSAAAAVDGTGTGPGSSATAGMREGPISPCVDHSRDIRMLSWLPGGDALAAAAARVAAPAVASVAPGAPMDVGCTGGAQTGIVSRLEHPQGTQLPVHTGAVSTASSSSSRAVRVPRAALGPSSATSRHRSRAVQPWANTAQDVSSQSMQACGSGAEPSSLQGALATATAMGSEGGGAGGHTSILEHAPSAAASSVDQEFYVGSFWSPKGLAAGPRRQQQQHVRAVPGSQLACSMSSLGPLDSLQDSLQLGTPSMTAELDDATSTLQSPRGQHPEPFECVGADVGCRTCSSSTAGGPGGGVRGLVHSSGGGAGDGEGLLEGCFPADSTGDCWEQAQHALQYDGTGAAVLVRVQSGAVDGESSSSLMTGKAATATTAAGMLGQAAGSAESSSRAGRLLSTPAAVSATAAAAPRPGNYSWIAKAVVSKNAQQQQQQQRQRPQFEAFDEPNTAEWYYVTS